MKSLTAVAAHQEVLKNLIAEIDSFELTEEAIKNIHCLLMADEQAWEVDFKPHLVGAYRNIPTIGSRSPYFEDKEYAPHFNLDITMPSHLNIMSNHLSDIDNSIKEKHLLTRTSHFHNVFLNEVHPFADGNGRVFRIIIGLLLMQNNCLPIFPRITLHEEKINYIQTIVSCEKEKSDIPLVKYLAEGMTAYLLERLKE